MRFEEEFRTTATPERAFEFASDFTNLSDWDPTIVEVRKLTGGKVGRGTNFFVRLRFLGATSELRYEVDRFEAPRTAVLVGKAPLCTATDTVLVKPRSGGAQVRWIADIRFAWPLSLLDPVLRILFRPSVEEAVGNLKEALDRLAPRTRTVRPIRTVKDRKPRARKQRVAASA